MKIQWIFLSFIVLSCLQWLSVDGRKRSPKNEMSQTLDERVQLLMEMNAKRPLLKFNTQHFLDFVKSTQKNYSVVIMFTALAPARQCVICQNAYEEYAILANSFRYSEAYSNKLFFAMVDFDGGSEIFKMLRMIHAPIFMHFPAKGKRQARDTMDLQRNGFQAESIAKWVQERTYVHINIYRPPDYTKIIVMLIIGSLVAGFLYLRRKNLQFLYNKRMWGIFVISFCFAMISGQMWNHIRGPPLIHRDGKGDITYIHDSAQVQFITESFIIIFLYAMIVLGMILLTESVQQANQRKARLMAIIGVILVLVFFSLILSVFRSKAQGYPYSFFFK